MRSQCRCGQSHCLRHGGTDESDGGQCARAHFCRLCRCSVSAACVRIRRVSATMLSSRSLPSWKLRNCWDCWLHTRMQETPERSSGGLQMETKSLDMEDPASGTDIFVQFEERPHCQSDCSGQLVGQIIGSVVDGGCRDAGFGNISW